MFTATKEPSLFSGSLDNKFSLAENSRSRSKFQSPLDSTETSFSTSSSSIAAASVPGGRPFAYSITATGITYAGSTAFLSANTQFTPIESFSLPGVLLIEPTIPPQNDNSSNGGNPREVLFYIGGDSSVAGALRYGTNTWAHRHYGGITIGRPIIDTSFVIADDQASTLAIGVDPQWAQNDSTNVFTWRTSLFATPKRVLVGNINISFTNGGRTVSGSITFAGGGIVEPGTYAYTASFTGELAA